MKNIIKKIGILFAVLVLLVVFPVAIQAQDAAGRITLSEIDLNTKQPVSGIKLGIYQVALADHSEDEITYTADFAGLSSKPTSLSESVLIDGNNQTSTTQKIEQYIASHRNIQPMQTAITDGNGEITFDHLPDGVYFFRQVGQAQSLTDAGKKATAYSFFISLPATIDGISTRTITDAKPKCIVESVPEQTDINVYKIWKDNNDKAGKRPKYIQVELLDSSTCVDKKILSDVNNWTCRWTGLETKGHDWSIKEVSVPDGYTSTIKSKGYNYFITNTIHPSPPRIVKTGDNNHPALWIGLIAITALGMIWMRKQETK
ncbi:Cna B-type domain-containing protein [Pseudoramibacter porci]|uniref:Cna B-type domain-containing protein n=1 Tax=Pseudoramibacter porci TaxID=2606631 RepID=A0A7X2NFE2_9FIRM|nr:Cna B-type domain-containing protein [Pseudoramibacter porci]MSS19415.1 Cna B-type domain-containing protein [Pseudoramibacter porci]